MPSYNLNNTQTGVAKLVLGCSCYECLLHLILCHILFYFILFYFILFYFILSYFILFYFILFYFIFFYFIFSSKNNILDKIWDKHEDSGYCGVAHQLKILWLLRARQGKRWQEKEFIQSLWARKCLFYLNINTYIYIREPDILCSSRMQQNIVIGRVTLQEVGYLKK